MITQEFSSPYEPPGEPEITIDTETESVESGAEEIIKYLFTKG